MAAFAQTTPPAPATAPAAAPAAAPEEPEILKERVSVRRFSAGLTASFTPLQAFKETLQTRTEAVGPAEFRSTPTVTQKYASYGINAQVALTDRFAVNLGAIRRNVSFENLTVKLVGTDNISTVFFDERIGTNYKTKVNARFIDIPVLLRFYSKSRYEDGLRFFVEGGPTFRRTTRVRSHTNIEFSGGETAANDDIPEYRKSAYGYTVGAGAQIIDPVGIRIIPGFRYTTWRTLAFDSFLVRGVNKQVEILFTLSF